jgi:hypothetical protein
MPITVPPRGDAAGELNRGVAEAATGVDRLVARLDVQRREDGRRMQRQAVDDDVLPADKFRNEDLVPEVDVLALRTLRLDLSDRHDGPPL